MSVPIHSQENLKKISIIGNLTLHVAHLLQSPFLSDVKKTNAEYTHLNFAVYDLEGARVKQVNQSSTPIRQCVRWFPQRAPQ